MFIYKRDVSCWTDHETRVYICHKNMKSMRFFKVFAENFIKNILLEMIMENGLSLSQQSTT